MDSRSKKKEDIAAENSLYRNRGNNNKGLQKEWGKNEIGEKGKKKHTDKR